MPASPPAWAIAFRESAPSVSRKFDPLHAQDDSIEPGGGLDPDLAQAVGQRVGVDEEEPTVETQDLQPRDRLAV